MKTNVGTIDRLVRAMLGLVLLYLAFFSGFSVFSSPLVMVVTAAVGVVMLVVAAVRFCPIYALLGVRTCRS